MGTYRPKPALAAWIQRERKRLGLSTQQLADRLTSIGAKVSEQTISVWESNADRRPSGYNLDALERIYGTKAPDRPSTEGDLSELAASIRDLARAIQEERAERLEWERGVLESVSSLARWLGQRDDPEPATHAGDRGAEPRVARA